MDELREAVNTNWPRVIDTFRQWDKDSNGTISKTEFQAALSTMGSVGLNFSRTTMEELFDTLDADGSGAVGYAEMYNILRRGASPHKSEKPEDGAHNNNEAAHVTSEGFAALSLDEQSGALLPLLEHLGGEAQSGAVLLELLSTALPPQAQAGWLTTALHGLGAKYGGAEAIAALFRRGDPEEEAAAQGRRAWCDEVLAHLASEEGDRPGDRLDRAPELVESLEAYGLREGAVLLPGGVAPVSEGERGMRNLLTWQIASLEKVVTRQRAQLARVSEGWMVSLEKLLAHENFGRAMAFAQGSGFDLVLPQGRGGILARLFNTLGLALHSTQRFCFVLLFFLLPFVFQYTVGRLHEGHCVLL